jgi:hypothetical protein
MIEPAAMIAEGDRALFIRFFQKAPGELAVLTPEGQWKWYEVVFRPAEQRPYLVPVEGGERATIAVACYEGEAMAIYWADPDLLPQERIETLAGGPCLRLPALPQYLQGEGFRQFCARAGYAAGMVYCAACLDLLPISGLHPAAAQTPCPHVRWCQICRCWSTPNYPGKDEQEADTCPHRSANGQWYVPPAPGD